MKQLSMAILLTLCVVLPASAQMYKWVDADGKVRYSDTPPPTNVKTEKLRIPAQAPAVPAPKSAASKAGASKEASKSAPRTPAEQEQAFRKRQQEAAKEQEKQAQKESETAGRADDCKRARAALAGLEAGGRQATVNEKGERVYLDEQQIVQEKARAQQAVTANCN